MSKSCIILSQGPVPTPEHTKVEGGGLRCWGLAKGMVANDKDMNVTVAYHEDYKQDKFTDKFEGVNIATWNVSSIPELISTYDSVVVSYCMSDLTIKTVDTIRPDQQLVLDCYVPIYVEVSARNTDDLDREYYDFHVDVGRWAHALRRGDVFLCSSEAQKSFYKGVLSGVGRINPASYGDDFIKVVPYGIYREDPKVTEKPITKLLGSKARGSKKILWFGGIYPWFDLRTLVDAVKVMRKDVDASLIIVGARNPFNDHPDFNRGYDELVEHVKTSGAEDFVVMQDWIKFEDRANWYLDADLVVVMNKLGEENTLSWRTRLVDFMWASLPVATNGGDPLGEQMIAADAAYRLTADTAQGLSKELADILGDEKHLMATKKAMANLKGLFYWDVVTKKLAEVVNEHHRAKDLQRYGSFNIADPRQGSSSKIIKVKKMASKAKMLPVYARKHGVQNTYYAIRTKVMHKLGGKVGLARKEPGIVMVSHQLDFSGAPYVFMDLVEAVAAEAGKTPIEVHTFNPAFKENLRRLNKMGITPNVHIDRGATIPYLRGDTIVLNTSAYSTAQKHHIYNALDTGELKKLVWYIHEDEPEFLFEESEAKIIKKLLAADKLVIFLAADKILANFQAYFDNKTNIRKQMYKYIIPERFHKIRKADDFDKLSFILPGTVGDGRKGQMPLFYALAEFKKNIYDKNPAKYRDFELVFVGITKDFLSRQINKHAPALFGERYKQYGIVNHERSSELMMASNVTICYSMRECLPLFVFEGMAAGHPIMRNDASGMAEQLDPGKNGFYLDSEDYTQIITSFEAILNKQTTTNAQLAKMSAASNAMALAQAKHSYKPMVKEMIGKK